MPFLQLFGGNNKVDPASKLFGEYASNVCDAFNACRYALAQMAAEKTNVNNKFMEAFLGKDSHDYNIWMGIQQQRKNLIEELMQFAEATSQKMSIIQNRLTNRKEMDKYQNFQECYVGFSSEEALALAMKLNEKGLGLRMNLVSFHEHIVKTHKTSVEKEKVKNLLAGAVLVTGAVAGMAFLAWNPAARIGATAVTAEGGLATGLAVKLGTAAVMDRAMEATANQIEKSLASLPNRNKHVEQFSKTEVDRATKFLNDDAKNERIGNSVHAVYTDNTILTAPTRLQCKAHIERMIHESKKLATTCQTVLNTPESNHLKEFETLKGHVGTVMKVTNVFKFGGFGGGKKTS